MKTESVVLLMRRDYRNPDDGQVWPMTEGMVHDPELDEPLGSFDVLKGMMDQLGAVDGDEVQLLMVKTGRRPHGDRWYLTLPEGSRPETDEEVERRIEGHEA